jgi:hypothetical protein
VAPTRLAPDRHGKLEADAAGACHGRCCLDCVACTCSSGDGGGTWNVTPFVLYIVVQ